MKTHFDFSWMKSASVTILVSLLFVGQSFAQSVKITGRITDKSTGQPVIGANIILPDGTGTSSGADGKFELGIIRFPVKLKISHISYRVKEIDLINDPKCLIQFDLDELVSEIREVKISAKKISILTENEDFSLQDFAFDKDNLWLLGYLKNSPARGRLWIADAFGDTITSISVRNPERLYTDLFGNVHLVMHDSVYQLYGEGKEIILLYAYERKRFFQTLDPIKALFAGKPVFQDYVRGKQGLHTYYFSSVDRMSYLLNVARDSVEEVRQIMDYVYGENFWILEGTHSPCMCVRDTCNKLLRDHKLTKDTVFYHNVRVPLFTSGDSLFVINQYKDSLLTYSPNGKFARATPITFHQDSVLFGVLYRHLTFLTDRLNQRMYLLQRKTSSWKLNEFNPSAGRAGRPVLLPDFPGMSGITVYDQAVYFLYPEKKYPNYVRLYRYQL